MIAYFRNHYYITDNYMRCILLFNYIYIYIICKVRFSYSVLHYGVKILYERMFCSNVCLEKLLTQ